METQYAIAVPYSFPPSGFWTDVINAAPTVYGVVANVASGPGSGTETNFQTVYNDCTSAGITLFGYVSTNGATVSLATCEAQIDDWYSFYGIANILFDVCACTTGNVSYYTSLVNYVHSHHSGLAILNPGNIPAETYFSTPIGDIIQVCEDSYANFPADAAAAPGWLFDYPSSQIAVTCNTCPNETDMENAVALSSSGFNAKYVWVTEDGDYVSEASYFSDFISLLAGGGGGGGSALITGSWSAGFAFPSASEIIAEELASSALAPPGSISLEVPVANVAGYWMVACIAWRTQTANGVPPADAPTVSVADDVHNWWEPMTPVIATSSGAGFVRATMWVAPAAKAASTVYVGPTGYTKAISCTVYNVAGVLPWFTYQPSTYNGSNGGTTVTVDVPASSSPALYFTVCASDDLAETISIGSGDGWGSITQSTADNGLDHTSDIDCSSTYQQVTSAGTVTATWNSTGSVNLATTLSGFLISAAPLVAAGQNWPAIIYECAPGFGFQTPPDQIAWTPLVASAMKLQITQGRQYEVAQLSAGEGTLLLDNPVGLFIPPGQAPYSGINSGTPVRMRTAWTGGDWQVSWSGNGTAANPQADSGLAALVVPAGTYSVNGWVASSIPWASGMYLGMAWYNSGGTYLSDTLATIAPSGLTASLLTATGTAPATSYSVNVIIGAAGIPLSSTVFYAAAAPPQAIG